MSVGFVIYSSASSMKARWNMTIITEMEYFINYYFIKTIWWQFKRRKKCMDFAFSSTYVKGLPEVKSLLFWIVRMWQNATKYYKNQCDKIWRNAWNFYTCSRTGVTKCDKNTKTRAEMWKIVRSSAPVLTNQPTLYARTCVGLCVRLRI